eukprot:g719.t1
MWNSRRWSSRSNSRKDSEKASPPRSSVPSPSDIANAEAIKNEGNILFSKGKYLAAAEKYTEAITIHPRWTIAIVNRANCYKRLARWIDVERDCRKALELDNQSMKAHYFLGIALEERNEHNEALHHLNKSYELARDKEDQIMDEIWQTIARVSYNQWKQCAHQRSLEDARLKSRLIGILKQRHQQELRTTYDPSGKIRDQETELEALESVFERASRMDKVEEIPSCLTCPLTMDVFRDPVISPSGSSYEYSVLKGHIEKAGSFDPITRQPIDKSNLIRNLNLRTAAHFYLQEHPWAWKESM